MEVVRFDRDTHQINLKTGWFPLPMARHIKRILRLSRKAGGLQKQRALKSYMIRSFHHILAQLLLFF